MRVDACRLLTLSKNDPPRKPRYDPLSSPGHPLATSPSSQHVAAQAVALRMPHVRAPRLHPRRQVGRDAQLVIHLPQQLPIPAVESPYARRPHANPSVGEDHEPREVHAPGRRHQAVLVRVHLQPQLRQLVADAIPMLAQRGALVAMYRTYPRTPSSCLTK